MKFPGVPQKQVFVSRGRVTSTALVEAHQGSVQLDLRRWFNAPLVILLSEAEIEGVGRTRLPQGDDQVVDGLQRNAKRDGDGGGGRHARINCR